MVAQSQVQHARGGGKDGVTSLAPGAEPAGHGSSRVLTVAIGIRLVCIIMSLSYFMFLLWGMFSLPRLMTQ